MKIAIAVPWFKPVLDPEEQISLRHLEHYLGGHDIFIVAPRGLDGAAFGHPVKRFEPSYFADPLTYSRLLLATEFYSQFCAYDYLLIYQLDCLVFSSNLDAWSELGFDYIGAPWLRAASNGTMIFTRVGNGGLSLRRVESCLRVIDVARNSLPWWRSAPRLFGNGLGDLTELSLAASWRKRLSILRELRRGPQWYLASYSLHEDRFWSDRARLFLPSFRIAPVEVALRFSFECEPRLCFERSGGRLPFGCHGWTKHDRSFWEPHLLPA